MMTRKHCYGTAESPAPDAQAGPRKLADRFNIEDCKVCKTTGGRLLDDQKCNECPRQNDQEQSEG